MDVKRCDICGTIFEVKEDVYIKVNGDVMHTSPINSKFIVYPESTRSQDLDLCSDCTTKIQEYIQQMNGGDT